VPTFDSLNPATGEVLAGFPIDTADDVRAAVARARTAAPWWREIGFAGRRQRLHAWRRLLVAGLTDLADLVHRENGKPVDDAIGEIAVAVAHLAWAARHAEPVLRRRAVRPGLLAINHAATVEYVPYGVVGVIGPWNFPVHTPMGSISYALAAGNAVVFKPSEYTPAIARWLVDAFNRAVPEHPVLQLVTGFGATGEALCRAGVDKIAFTGSTAIGRKVMASCAPTLTPVVMECGGKDALIVAADADLSAAADGAVWGSMANAGQSCVGVERAYVVAEVYDEFVRQVVEQARGLRPGIETDASYGPITMPAQLEVIAAHLAAAQADGGQAVLGGTDSVQPPFVAPSVLVDVPEDSIAITDETFGPTLTITRVSDVDQAIERVNASRLRLGAAVFSARQGPEVAARLATGMVTVNSVFTVAMTPSLPFGGVQDSGFGRIHGADGLREFAWAHSVTRQRVPPLIALTTFRRSAHAVDRLATVVRARWGR
jgi:acyl-CoA reductase-like NAD-dependent aldehyde dehydrogenase